MIDSGRDRDFPDRSNGCGHISSEQGMSLKAPQGQGVNPAPLYHIPLKEMFDVKADMEQTDLSGAAFAFRETVEPPRDRGDHARVF
jgi:hypothetical protein